jgi:hypothetical protein
MVNLYTWIAEFVYVCSYNLYVHLWRIYVPSVQWKLRHESNYCSNLGPLAIKRKMLIHQVPEVSGDRVGPSHYHCMTTLKSSVCFFLTLFCKGIGIYFTLLEILVSCAWLYAVDVWWAYNNIAQADGFTYQYIVHWYQNSIYESHTWSPVIVWGLNCTVLYDPLSRELLWFRNYCQLDIINHLFCKKSEDIHLVCLYHQRK